MTVSKSVEFNLREKLYIISRRRWVLIATIVIIFTIVAIANFTAAPLYQAVTRINIEPRLPKIVPFKELYSISGKQLDYYNTQYKVLKSRSMAKKVLENLPAGEKEGLSISKLINMVTIKPIAQSQLVDIKVVGKNPELTALVADLWAEQFIRLAIDSKLKAIQIALSQLTKQLDAQNEIVKIARQELIDYKEKERIISLEDVRAELDRLSESYSEVKREREEKELQLKYMKKSSALGLSLETFPQIRYHSIIMQLKNHLIQLQANLAENSQRYKAKHPKTLQLEAEIKTVRSNLKEEIEKITHGLQAEYQLAMANEEELLSQLEEHKTLAFNMERKVAALEDLSTKVLIRREGQQALLSRVNETSMTKGIEITNIRIVDYAEVPRAPFKPRKIYNLMLALIVGTAGGIGAIFLLENIDNTIKTSTEAKKVLKIPFLGAIPLYSQVNINPRFTPLDIMGKPLGLIPEAYRTIRTGIYFSSPDRSPRILLITSSLPQEGKTEVSAMLSLILARGDEKILLIDSDMRKPRIEKVFGLDRGTNGLSELLSGQNSLDEVVQPSGIPGLDIIGSGHIPPNPSELINSRRFREILTEASEQWDRIIMDSPPLLSVTDATILGQMADGVIIVIRAGHTSGKIAAFCREKLDHANARFVGIILNGADIHRGQNYYYYQSYYKEERT
jgi:polysaccharide biosynthesis transport protein